MVFLGTGGGRFVSYTQLRWTGGIRFLTDKLQLHLDPGSGAIVRSVNAKLRPQKIKFLFISHSHPDHCCDAEIFIEAMTRGMTRRNGILVAPKSVLSGNDVCEATISKYHQKMIKKLIEVKPGDTYNLQGFSFVVTKTIHTDPDTVGYCFNFPEGRIGYTSDTSYFEEISKQYLGTRLMILCVMRPRGFPWRGHLSVDDAVNILKNVQPEMAIITHLGAKMIFSHPFEQAKHIEEETGIRTIAATDGMQVSMKREIEVIKHRTPQKNN